MNYTLIVLGVILCVIIYIMFQFMGGNGKIVTNIVTLNGSTTNPAVPFSSLSVPTSQRYYLSFWINVEKLAGSTDIFKIQETSSTPLTLKLTAASELMYNIGAVDHLIMINFPLQKWVYVILSIDGSVVDIYIDGKMIRSEKLTAIPTAPTKDASIVFTKPTDTSIMYIAKFERNPTPIDPSTAWSNYMAGNGGNYFSSLFSSYGANFTLTKDNLDVNKLSLF